MKKSGPIKSPKFIIGVDSGKTAIMSATGVEKPGPRYMHYPRDYEAGYDMEFFRGLISEKLVIHRRGGKAVMAWEKTYERNEPLDCRNYATAAMEIYGTHALKDRVPVRKNRRGVVSKGIENPMG